MFYGNAYEGDGIVFCLDESKSMNKAGRWKVRQREAIRAISELSARSEFGLVFYGAGAHSFRKSLVPASEANKQAAIAFVQARQMSLGTCLGPGIGKSLKLVQRAGSK